MNTDIRLSTGFFTHPKTRKLEKQLGVEGVRSLLVLWLWVAQNKPDGCLKGMDWEYIELAADWRGEERAFFDHCLGAWIDEVGGEYFIHGWKEHNPWAAEADDRSAKARFSRLAKVNRPEYDRLYAAGVNAISREEYEQLTSVKHPLCEQVTEANETSTERQPNVNDALTPAPAPSPSPAPNALKDNTPPNGGVVGADTPTPEKSGGEQAELCPTPSGGEKAMPCPYEKIKDMYHATFPEHPHVAFLEAGIKRNIKCRWIAVGKRLREINRPDTAEERLAYFQRLFDRAAASDFLTGKKPGKNGGVYLVNFPKLMSASGFANVAGGVYDNRQEAW